MDTLIFSQAIVGFELSCRARRLSPNTIQDYMRTLWFIGEMLGLVSSKYIGPAPN
jgi:hypothetical protein